MASEMMKKVGDKVEEAWKFAKDRLSGAESAVEDTAQAVGDTIQDKVEAVKERVGGTGEETVDALALLKQDHRTVDGLFASLEELGPEQNRGREELFGQLLYELDTHALVEEQLFYPRLRQSPEDKDMVAEAAEEHLIVKRLLQELTVGEPGSVEWRAKLKVLKENVQHHVKEEENEIFPRAREILGEEELMKMGAQIEQTKRVNTQLGQERAQGQPSVTPPARA